MYTFYIYRVSPEMATSGLAFLKPSGIFIEQLKSETLVDSLDDTEQTWKWE